MQSLSTTAQTVLCGRASWRQGDDPAFGIVKTLTVEYTVDGKPHKASGQDPDTHLTWRPTAIADAEPSGHADRDCRRHSVLLEAWQNGRFELTTASGRKLAGTVQDLPPAQTVAGPWQVKFPAGVRLRRSSSPSISSSPGISSRRTP